MDKKQKSLSSSKESSWVTLYHPEQNLDLGVLWQWDCYKIVFGNRHLTEAEFSITFPEITVSKIKQIHSSKVVLASTELVEADAHFTTRAQVALQIKTADCMPIFIVAPETHTVMAIHSGWRGVVGKIVEKAMNALVQQEAKISSLIVVMGPHIHKQSFEVDQPVWVELMDAIPVDFHHMSSQYYEKIVIEAPVETEKYKVNLEGIVRAQFMAMGLHNEQIQSFSKDTMTDPLWHSHRRDREQSGRNISFVMREEAPNTL